jgi:hypothetical protein
LRAAAAGDLPVGSSRHDDDRTSKTRSGAGVPSGCSRIFFLLFCLRRSHRYQRPNPPAGRNSLFRGRPIRGPHGIAGGRRGSPAVGQILAPDSSSRDDTLLPLLVSQTRPRRSEQ